VEPPNAVSEQPDLQVRRLLFKRAGMALGASGVMAALALSAGATSREEEDEILVLWRGVISAQERIGYGVKIL